MCTTLTDVQIKKSCSFDWASNNNWCSIGVSYTPTHHSMLLPVLSMDECIYCTGMIWWGHMTQDTHDELLLLIWNFMSIDEWWYWEELKVNERTHTHTHNTTCTCIIPMCLCRLYTSHGVYTYKFVLGPLPIHCSSSSPGGSLCKPGKCHYIHGAWCQNRRQNTKILPVQTNWKKKANCRQSASQYSFLPAQVRV